jgi:ribosomal protein L10
VRREQKSEVVAGLEEALRQSSSMILTDYRGLTVKDITDLRIALEKLGARMQVVKNTLLRRALSEEQHGLDAYLEGPVAATFLSGNYGAVLKAIGTGARGEMESLLRTRVFLDLRVKVLKEWQRDPKALRRLGF